MLTTIIMSVLVLGSVTPLTGDQRTRLDTARDGRDHQEEAFVALVENVTTWTPGGPGDEPVRLQTRLPELVEAPGERRGELYRLRGVLQQATRLPRPHETVEEWFLRDEAGQPFLVYVHRPGEEAPPPDGMPVVVDARFYKAVEFVARDGRPRTYAAFVGALPIVERPGASGAPPGLLGLLAALGATFLLLLVITRRGPGRPRVHVSPEAEIEDEAPLPEDPAEALAELHRRADPDGRQPRDGRSRP